MSYPVHNAMTTRACVLAHEALRNIHVYDQEGFMFSFPDGRIHPEHGMIDVFGFHFDFSGSLERLTPEKPCIMEYNYLDQLTRYRVSAVYSYEVKIDHPLGHAFKILYFTYLNDPQII